MAGRAVEASWDGTRGHEVLLAFHFWILDYRSDGRRRGFPLDPYLLYLHRRLVRAGEAVDRLLSQDQLEYLLIPNLENETYLQLLLSGSLESLPAKLAEASRESGTFNAWRSRRRPRLLGELPRRLLREDDFVDHLLDACVQYCQSAA